MATPRGDRMKLLGPPPPQAAWKNDNQGGERRRGEKEDPGYGVKGFQGVVSERPHGYLSLSSCIAFPCVFVQVALLPKTKF